MSENRYDLSPKRVGEIVEKLLFIERSLDPEGERSERHARLAATEALLLANIVQNLGKDSE